MRMSSKENDTILSFINQMLMEEEDDLESKHSALHDSLALRATEQSLYEAINTNLHQEDSTSNYANATSNYSHFDPPSASDHNHFLGQDAPSEQNFRKNRYREDDHLAEYHRSNKQLASSANASEPEPLEMYDNMLLFPDKSKRKPSQGNKELDMAKECVDLRSLLMHCAQAIVKFDRKEVNRLMVQIRRHSSPHGQAAQRVAHYFANALEAHMAGTGTALHTSLNTKKLSGAEVLKVNKMFITAVPFMTMTNLLANGTVMSKVAMEGATTLHIIDFGILFGFQWPSLILALSERPGGPPKLRITGIDYPQAGFRPAEMVLDTGVRLAEYCRRFGVPFEYNAIAQKFEAIRLEDLKIEKGELVVVNSINRLQNVTDLEDVVNMNVPRDDVLNLIRRINPDMFIHAVIHGTHNTPFFIDRFREAFFHFSSVFDMFEATVPWEEEEDQSARVRFEDQVLGRSVMSVVACEGTDRVERPETYKQWQERSVKAGFRQIPLDGEIVKRLGMVREDYHKGFSVVEDGKWILLGWKGLVIHGVSCWQPVHLH